MLKTVISDRSQIISCLHGSGILRDEPKERLRRRLFCGPTSDRSESFVSVQQINGMSETGERWFFRPASCKQKQAFVWRPI